MFNTQGEIPSNFPRTVSDVLTMTGEPYYEFALLVDFGVLTLCR